MVAGMAGKKCGGKYPEGSPECESLKMIKAESEVRDKACNRPDMDKPSEVRFEACIPPHIFQDPQCDSDSATAETWLSKPSTQQLCLAVHAAKAGSGTCEGFASEDSDECKALKEFASIPAGERKVAAQGKPPKIPEDMPEKMRRLRQTDGGKLEAAIMPPSVDGSQPELIRLDTFNKKGFARRLERLWKLHTGEISQTDCYDILVQKWIAPTTDGKMEVRIKAHNPVGFEAQCSFKVTAGDEDIQTSRTLRMTLGQEMESVRALFLVSPHATFDISHTCKFDQSRPFTKDRVVN